MPGYYPRRWISTAIHFPQLLNVTITVTDVTAQMAEGKARFTLPYRT
ncbi:hypothetical protein SACS_0528 [Parasaccharibacter apium]|uniref:Uncharacterized protein n=1 Tax=Parasaccharibacter apium TaxID=1510841 RepID=A0A7U7G500_9PROT|nr:hypothetical protein SACS_0528 [Parasaccharibacter apium]